MKLDESKVYSLEELTSEEFQDLWMYLTKVDESWTGDIVKIQLFKSKYLYFCFDWKEKGEWLVSSNVDFIKGKQVTNAKELFYTLKNVQVDCRELTVEQIKEMADVFEANGFEIGSLNLSGTYIYLRDNSRNYCMVNECDKNKTTITYEKFMELFSEEVTLNLESNHLNDNIFSKEIKKINVQDCSIVYEKYKPQQYQIGIDTFERCEANMTKEEILACVRMNIDKYNWRKKGQDLEDLEKIIAYANWGIKQLNKP